MRGEEGENTKTVRLRGNRKEPEKKNGFMEAKREESVMVSYAKCCGGQLGRRLSTMGRFGNLEVIGGLFQRQGRSGL